MPGDQGPADQERRSKAVSRVYDTMTRTAKGEAAGLSFRREWIIRLSAAAILAWCVVATVSAFLTARTRPHDPWAVAELEGQFRRFALDLPPLGTIGYLEPYVDAGSDQAVAMYYAAQYGLAPRVLDRSPVHEFLIVPRGAARPDSDPRLAGFALFASAPGGHRLYRRFP